MKESTGQTSAVAAWHNSFPSSLMSIGHCIEVDLRRNGDKLHFFEQRPIPVPVSHQHQLKPFCSINESAAPEKGEFGFYEDLPHLIWLFGNITVWQPTKDVIELAHKQGRSAFSAQQFLELVRKGYIRVVGRQGWFEGKLIGSSKDICKDGDKRNGWEFSTYYSDFDGVLAGFADESKGTRGSVVFAELADDEARSFASTCIANRNENYENCLGAISSKLAPTGLLEKLESLGAAHIDEIVRVGIFDSYRHKEIADRLDANIPLEGTYEGAFYTHVTGPLKNQPKMIDKPFSKENLGELIDLHKSLLLQKKDFNDFLRLLEVISENRRHRQLYNEALFNIARPVDTILEELTENANKYLGRSYMDYLGPTLGLKISSLGGLALAAYSMPAFDWRMVNGQNNTALLVGLLLSVTGPLQAKQIKLGQRKIPDYSGNQSFYMGRFPNADPTTSKLKILIQELQEYKG